MDTVKALDNDGTTDVLRSGAEIADRRGTSSLEEGAAIRNIDEIEAGPLLERFNMVMMVVDVNYKGYQEEERSL